jgi:hypothetical protein
MPYFDQAQFDIRCEWGLQGVQQIVNSDVIIIVDVLSFTTSVDVAVSRGSTIFPYRWKDETATTRRDTARSSAEISSVLRHLNGVSYTHLVAQADARPQYWPLNCFVKRTFCRCESFLFFLVSRGAFAIDPYPATRCVDRIGLCPMLS